MSHFRHKFQIGKVPKVCKVYMYSKDNYLEYVTPTVHKMFYVFLSDFGVGQATEAKFLCKLVALHNLIKLVIMPHN